MYMITQQVQSVTLTVELQYNTTKFKGWEFNHNTKQYVVIWSGSDFLFSIAYFPLPLNHID